MKACKILFVLFVAVVLALVCSGFQKTEEITMSHVYYTSDGDINSVAAQYYKYSDKDVVGTLEDYQMLVRMYNRDKYNLSRRHLQAGDILTIPVRRAKK